MSCSIAGPHTLAKELGGAGLTLPGMWIIVKVVFLGTGPSVRGLGEILFKAFTAILVL